MNPQLSHTNIMGLNYLLRSEIFVSEDRQLRAVHLILDFEPISRVFQDIGHAIRTGDPRINRINVSKPTFLAKEDLPLVRLPVQQIPPQLVVPLQQVPFEASVATAEEEIASSRLSLEEEINQFRFVEDAGPSEKPVDISNFETDSVDISSIHPRQLVITQIDSESEEEEDQMDQKKRPGLRGLLAKNKGGSSKEAPKTQPPEIPIPPPPIDLGLQAMPNLKKRRPD